MVAAIGTLVGFLVGSGVAYGLSGMVFMGSLPIWFWHLLAAAHGLSIGLTGTLRFRGWGVKLLSLVAPPALALMGSLVALRNVEHLSVQGYVWFGTMAALAGAATGLLAGFSCRSLGGFVAGMVSGQLVAWPMGVLFFAALKADVPYGFAVALAYAAAGGLTHLTIACALRWAKADLVPQRNLQKLSSCRV